MRPRPASSRVLHRSGVRLRCPGFLNPFLGRDEDSIIIQASTLHWLPVGWGYTERDKKCFYESFRVKGLYTTASLLAGSSRSCADSTDLDSATCELWEQVLMP